MAETIGTPTAGQDPAAEDTSFYHESALNATWTGTRLAIGGLCFLFGAFVFIALARVVDSEELHLAIDLLLRRRPRDLVPLP